jgi:type IV pilus assembly protein PilX
MVLLLLVVVTLIGLSGRRGTVMEERMTASTRDRSLAFQAAEAALRAGEDFVARNKPVLNGICNEGMCGVPNPDAPPVWDVPANWDDATEVTTNLGGQVMAPQYIVELLASNVPSQGGCVSISISDPPCSGTERRYRITARSSSQGRAEVILQSIYAVP